MSLYVQPDAMEIREALAKVLGSRQFSSAERRKKLLEYLVAETVAGRGADLKEFRIGVDVYGRDPATYDPRIDPVIRVDIGRLRTKLAEYYAGDGCGEGVRIELPKGSYSVQFQPAAPSPGTPADEPVAEPQHPPPLAFPRAWRKVAIAAAGVAMILAVAVLWRSTRHSSSISGTLAILPFNNLTADPSNDYFSDGLTDDLTARLGRIQKLRVVSRASTFQFKDKKATPREIGRELGASLILQGSVQRSGERIRVVAQLNAASDGSLIWSDVFDGDGLDELRLEDQIAQAVSVRLGDSIVPIPATRNPAVHDLYLRGRFFQSQNKPAALLRAIELYRQGLALDPRDPDCNAALAAAELYLANMGQIAPEEADRVARPLVQTAIEADPSSGDAHLVLAGLLYLNDHNRRAAEREFKKAAQLSPNATDIANNYGYFLMYNGLFDEAEVQFARAKAIDPLSVVPHFNMGSLYAFRRDYRRAEAELRIVVEASPGSLPARIGLADVLAFEGKFDAAYQELDRARALMVSPEMGIAFKAIFLARQGKRAEARDVLAKLPEAPGTYYLKAIAYIELGDRDTAFRYLGQAYQAREGNLVTLPVNVSFAPARKDPRFQDLLRRMGAL